MKSKKKLLFFAILFCFATAKAQNIFPSGGKTGIGTLNPESLLHINTYGTAAFPSKSSRGNIMQLFQADNNGFEIGLANGVNTRKAWILARHVSVPEYGENYSTLHLQPQIDIMSQYRGVAIGYFANTDVSIGTGLAVSGNVGIGTSSPQEKLSVNGNIRAHQIKVETSNWPDYVFNDDHQILSLLETEKYIKENKHLPEVPKAEIVEREGYSLNEMDKILLKKIEELTLHLIRVDKENKELKELVLRKKNLSL